MAAKDAVEKVLKDLGDTKDLHRRLIERLDRSEKAYFALFDSTRTDVDPDNWHSKLRPPWVNHIAETTVAALLDDKIGFRVKPAAKMYNPGEYQVAKDGAKAHQDLLKSQMAQNRFSEVQRPFVLQNQLASLSVLKTTWQRTLIPRKKLVVEQTPITDEMTGMPLAFFPQLKEVENVEPLYEGWVSEVVNIRDFFWHEAAVSADKCRFFIHRIYFSKDDLEKLAKRGIYNREAVNAILNPQDKQLDPEQKSHDARNRTKDMIEVLEHWNMETRMVTTVAADGKHLLREAKFPYWHSSHPFTICSTQPYPFQLDTLSQVEKIADLQEALWDMANQTHDNVRLLNNAITIVRSHFDVGQLEYAPGAFWPVEDPSEVTPWTPNPLPAEVSLGVQSGLMQSMQNLAGSQPFTSTSTARSIGADTATEAALVTSIAQQATKQMKTQINYALERVGQQALELNQQFVRKEIYVERVGLDRQPEIAEILPQMLQGSYRFDISPMNESLMRSERRAESTQFLGVLAQVAPVAASQGVQFNWRAIAEDVFEAWDVEEIERYILPPAPPQAPPGPGAPQGAPGEPPLGMTAPQATDQQSPSNQTSVSPERMLQRNLAMAGGFRGGMNGG